MAKESVGDKEDIGAMHVLILTRPPATRTGDDAATLQAYSTSNHAKVNLSQDFKNTSG
jgi:hypothetical protein